MVRMRIANSMLAAVALIAVLTGCVPGQPQRAVETTQNLAEAWVGASDAVPNDFTCPGVTLDPRETAAPDATIQTEDPSNQANGTIVVPVTVEIDGQRERYEVTLRQDGACVLSAE